MADRVGTSGWSYDEWKGPFYPDDLPSSEMLSWYAQRLGAVEVNNTLTRTPQDSAAFLMLPPFSRSISRTPDAG